MTKVTLYKGTTEEKAKLILKNGSAGGCASDSSCGTPSEKQARNQVGTNETTGSFNADAVLGALKLIQKGLKIALSPSYSQVQKNLVLQTIKDAKISDEEKSSLAKLAEERMLVVEREIDPKGVIEYTTSPEVAKQFARSSTSGIYIEVEIDSSYLADGSGSENGKVCFNSAPLLKFVTSRNI